jgi:4-amino-4-deoxy-L-arabinose transferase-like glycosyltransferase
MTTGKEIRWREQVWVIALLVFVAAGAYLRFVAVDTTEVDDPLRADAGDYVAYTYNLTRFGVYSRERTFRQADPHEPAPDALRSPAYPVFLMPLLAGGEPDAKFVRRAGFAQALIGLLCVPLVFWLARFWCGTSIALIPAAFIALSPHQVSFSTLLLTETLSTLLVLLAALAIVFAARARGGSGWRWGLVGLLLGLASLTRPTLQYFVLAVAIVALVSLGRTVGLRVAILAVTGFALAYAPWLLRNWNTLGFSSDPTLMISTIHHGSYPGFMYQGRRETFEFPYRYDPASAEISRDLASVTAHVRRQFESDATAMTWWYLIGKPLAFFSWRVGQSRDPVLQYPVLRSPFRERIEFKLTERLVYALHIPLVVFGLAGFALATWRRARDPAASESGLPLLGLMILYAIAVHVIGAPFGRYNVPFMPLIAVGAAYLVEYAVRHTQASAARQ